MCVFNINTSIPTSILRSVIDNYNKLTNHY